MGLMSDEDEVFDEEDSEPLDEQNDNADEMMIVGEEEEERNADEDAIVIDEEEDEDAGEEKHRLSAHRDNELFHLFDGQQSEGHVEFGRVERVQGVDEKEERENYVFGMNVSTGAQSVQLEVLLVLGIFLMIAAAIMYLYYRTASNKENTYQSLE